MTISNWITIGTVIIGYIASALTSWWKADKKNDVRDAVLETKLDNLDNKVDTLSDRVDKHNHLVERMVAVEQSTKSSHHRQDRYDEELDDLRKEIKSL